MVEFVGYLRITQYILGTLALVIGSIHIKDYFAFKKGVSLSIPEAAKPIIYARAQKIVTAESLTGAIIGASILAVLVNFIELLCTAGLPAMYTEILLPILEGLQNEDTQTTRKTPKNGMDLCPPRGYSQG